MVFFHTLATILPFWEVEEGRGRRSGGVPPLPSSATSMALIDPGCSRQHRLPNPPVGGMSKGWGILRIHNQTSQYQSEPPFHSEFIQYQYIYQFLSYRNKKKNRRLPGALHIPSQTQINKQTLVGSPRRCTTDVVADGRQTSCKNPRFESGFYI